MDQNSGFYSSAHSSHSSFTPQLSRTSVSSTTDFAFLREVLDFTKENIPGLTTIKKNYLNFDFGEGDIIARTQMPVSGNKFKAVFIEENFIEFGIEYFGVIRVIHPDIILEINIPNERSYDPAGSSLDGFDNEYLNSDQFTFLTRIVAIEVKAASLGVREKDLGLIRKSISPLLEYHMKKKFLMEWMSLQIKLTCYRKLKPPRYSEFLRLKTFTKELKLGEGRDHTKEYLEKCMQFDRNLISYDKIYPPNAYYKSLMKHELSLPYQLKLRYTEIETNESLVKSAESAVLTFLPKFTPDMDDYIEKGKKFSDLTQTIYEADRGYTNGLAKIYLQYEHDENECKVM